jgi:hypothetical protein
MSGRSEKREGEDCGQQCAQGSVRSGQSEAVDFYENRRRGALAPSNLNME